MRVVPTQQMSNMQRTPKTPMPDVQPKDDDTYYGIVTMPACNSRIACSFMPAEANDLVSTSVWCLTFPYGCMCHETEKPARTLESIEEECHMCICRLNIQRTMHSRSVSGYAWLKFGRGVSVSNFKLYVVKILNRLS